MNDLYSYVLASLRKLSQARSEAAFNSYLKSLQPKVKQLRKAYLDHQVVVDYSEPDVQAAYLIAYYPQYAEMTFQALDHFAIDQEFVNRNNLAVCLFGSGPSPEIVGLLSYLKDSSIDSISIETFDIAADTWKLSRDITSKEIRPQIWTKEFSLKSHTLDFCRKNSFHSIRDSIKNSQLFIFQNCLNELFSAQEIVRENIKFLLEEMPASSTLILADQGEHQEVANAMNGVELLVSALNDKAKIKHKLYFVERSEGEKAHFSTKLVLPQVIKANLLTGEDRLKPRRNVKASYLKVFKSIALPDRVLTTVSDQPDEANQSLVAQLEKELQQLKQTEAKHYGDTLVLVDQLHKQLEQISGAVEKLVEIATAYETNSRAISEQVAQLEADAAAKHNALLPQLDQLQGDVQHLTAKLDRVASTIPPAQIVMQVAQLEQAIQTVQQQVNRVEARLSQEPAIDDRLTELNQTLQRQAEIDREGLVKRLKQTRTVVMLLAFVSVLSFIMATIALFR